MRGALVKTIHRSQGDTMQKAVVDLTTRRKIEHIHYVAISRVQTLTGLAITNLQEDKIGVDKNVKTEIERLRASTIKPSLRFMYQIEQSEMKLCFLNACSMNRHLEDIVDNSIIPADIACFSEIRFLNRDS